MRQAHPSLRSAAVVSAPLIFSLVNIVRPADRRNPIMAMYSISQQTIVALQNFFPKTPVSGLTTILGLPIVQRNK